MRKYTIEDMQKLAKQRGGLCLSKEFLTTKVKLKWECREGHQWEAVPASLIRGSWCKSCYSPSTLSMEEMRQIAKERKGKCLSHTYINNRKKLTWECSEGHQWDATPSHIKNGTWCPICVGRYKKIEDMKLIAIQRNGFCLSDKYINHTTKLQWSCSEGHQWSATPSSIMNAKTWCPKCEGSEKLTFQDMRSLAKSRGGDCLSKEYNNAHTKLHWKCKEGHEWNATPDSIKRGSWCPECSKSYYFHEAICRTIFEQLFGEKFPIKRPSWLKNSQGNQMHLDGYCKKLNIAFEYQGEQHFKKGYFVKTDWELKKRKDDDTLKKKLCRQNNVMLFVFSYTPTLISNGY